MRAYMNGKPLDEVVDIPSSDLPSGIICMWGGSDIPEGWAICDGQNGTPDLRDRFVLGSGSRPIGETGGEEEVTLTVDQLPNHAHTLKTIAEAGTPNGGVLDAILTTAKCSRNDKAVGNGPYDGLNGRAHPNMPPYYVLAYIMKL